MSEKDDLNEQRFHHTTILCGARRSETIAVYCTLPAHHGGQNHVRSGAAEGISDYSWPVGVQLTLAEQATKTRSTSSI